MGQGDLAIRVIGGLSEVLGLRQALSCVLTGLGQRLYTMLGAGCCVILLALAAVGQGACAASLTEVYALSRQNDTQYAEAQARFLSAQEKLVQGRAGLMPTLAVTASALNMSRKFVEPQADEMRYQSRQHYLTLSQPLFRWQNWLQYQQGGLLVAQAEAEFAQARQDLILRVSQAYFDVLLAEDTVRSLESQMQAIDQQLAQAKAYFEVGTATITDTHEAQARHDLAEAQLIAARSDLAVKQAALSVLTGQTTESLAGLQQEAELLRPQPEDLSHWVQAAEEGNPGVQAKAANAEAAKLEAEKQQSGHLPTLDLVGTIGRTHDNVFAGTVAYIADIDQNSLGVQLNIPLFQGGGVSSRAREAAANQQAAKAALEGAKRQAAQSARQHYLGVLNGVAQVKALQAAEASSQLALKANKLGYEVGVRVNIDVLNAEQQWQTTRRDLSRARFDALLAQLRLKSAVGMLSEADLEAVNRMLLQ